MTPRISVFTPSHDQRWLGAAYRSLAAQTYHAWEWTILLNGPAAEEEIRLPGSGTDERVRIARDPWVTGVGAAKYAAVDACRGEILVELDHDDLLLPHALERVAAAFDDQPGAGLVYSRHAEITDAESLSDAEPFDRAFGWAYTPVTLPLHGSGVSPDPMWPTPHNVSLIWFAPNHLRAFTRAAYDRAGGYDPERDVLDDQDLMCRLYREGPFVRLDELLYLQRAHGGMTQRDPATNARIQTETVALYDANIQPNVLAWAAREGLLALDLGAAHGKPPGYLGVDMQDGPDVDLCGDALEILEQMPESSAGVIRAVDFLEHVADPVSLLNEIYRVLAHGGMLLSLTPSTDGRGAFQDPTHVRFYNENSFWYYTDRDFARYVPEIRCRFQTSRLVTYFPTPWHEQHDVKYVCWNGIAVKDGAPRNGGRLAI